MSKYEIVYERIGRSELSRVVRKRVPVTQLNDELSDILEHMKFAEFQNSEAHIEGLVDSDCNLLEIETYEVIVEDADPLTLWFA